MIDLNSIIGNLIASSPVAAVAFWGWYKAEKRAEKWEKIHIEQSASVLVTLTAAAEAMKE